MRLIRLGAPGAEKPAALLDDENYIDLSDVVDDFNEAFFAADRMAEIAAVVASRAGNAQPIGDLRIGAPIARPHQILCIGLNYSDHAAETGAAVPSEPILLRSRQTPCRGRTTTCRYRGDR